MKNFKRGEINVYGAGLAGCEAAYVAAKCGVHVNLYEMKPKKFTPPLTLSTKTDFLST